MTSGGGDGPIRAHGGVGNGSARGGGSSSRSSRIYGEAAGSGLGAGSIHVYSDSMRAHGGDGNGSSRGGGSCSSRIYGVAARSGRGDGSIRDSIRVDGGDGNGSARGGGSSSSSGAESGEDRFTSLPAHLIGRILSYLNVDEGARTAMLSRRMRLIWRHNSPLIIDDSRFNCMPNLQLAMELIRGAISCHAGLVQRLAIRRLPHFSLFGLMEPWMKTSALSRITELILSFPGEKLQLPPFVLGFNSLELLELRNCTISGQLFTLPLLRSLKLASVCISEATLSGIVNNATHLQTLVLKMNAGYSVLSLSLPDLSCLLIYVDNTPWDEEDLLLQKIYISNSPKLNRLLISTVDDAHAISVAVCGNWTPQILGSNLGTRSVELQHGFKKLQRISVLNLDLSQTWASVKILSVDVPEHSVSALATYMGLFPSLDSLHVYISDADLLAAKEDLPYCSDEPAVHIQFSVRTVVLRFYTGEPEQVEFARRLLENANELHTVVLETEMERPMRWLKVQRYLMNFEGRACQKAEVLFCSNEEALCPTEEQEIHAGDPFLPNYAVPYHMFKAEAPSYILQSRFVVTQVDVVNKNLRLPQLQENTTFDEVSLVKAYCEEYDLYLQLDVGTWVYQMSDGETFVITFTTTLNLDGTPDAGLFTSDSVISLKKYEHCMSGRVYDITGDPASEVLASFCGLEMKLMGTHSVLANFQKQHQLFLLMSRSPR